MITLPALIKGGNVAAKLERAQGELAKAEADLIVLRDKIAGLDVEDDSYATTAQTLNAQISVQEKSLSILSLQVAGLETKAAAEHAAERERRRVAAIRKAETELLPQYLSAVEDHAAALLGPHTTRGKLVEATRRIVKSWPTDDLELPFAFYLDVSRSDRVSQFLLTAVDADAQDIAADFVAHEVKMISDLIKSWKEPPAATEEAA